MQPAVVWRADPPRSPAARRAAVAAERKQVYAFLKASDARAVAQVARAFGLRGAKRRKRRVVKALFEDAAVATASAAVVRRARHDGEPDAYFVDGAHSPRWEPYRAFDG